MKKAFLKQPTRTVIPALATEKTNDIGDKKNDKNEKTLATNTYNDPAANKANSSKKS